MMRYSDKVGGVSFCGLQTQKFAAPFFFALVTAIFLTSGEFAATQGNIHFWGVAASLFAAIFFITARQVANEVSFTHVDLCALFFFAWMILTCALQANRFSFNMISVWVIGAAIWFLTRQLLTTRARINAMILLLLALTFSEAVLAIYQWKFVLPPLAQLTSENLMAMRESLQIRSEQELMLLTSRLRTADPTGTYILSNTLGGQLATGLILLLSLTGTICQRGGLYRNIIFVATSLMMFAALILTHCRSAVLAFAFVALIMIGNLIPQRKIRFALGAVIFLAAIFFVSVNESARKSLLFRAEYWQSTMTMIADVPIFGCGGGNFQIVYPQYKLPQASEEIADPHNFSLELCATAGVPALITFGLLLFCVVGSIKAGKERGALTLTLDSVITPEYRLHSGFSDDARWHYTFIALGTAVAVFISDATPITMSPIILVALLIVLPLFAYLERKIDFNFITREKLIFPLAVLLIHLLAAGGIAYTNTHLWLWILLPMMINLSRHSHERGNDGPIVNRYGKTFLSLIFFGAALWIYFANYLPVTQAFIFQSEAEVATDLAAQKEGWQKARRADPRNHEIAYRSLLSMFAVWKDEARESSPQSLAELEDAIQYATSLAPPYAKLYHSAGSILREVAMSFGENDARRGEWQRRAIEILTQATKFYPQAAAIRVSLALALQQAGDEPAARREGEKALALDAQMPHVDKKLKHAEIETLNRLVRKPQN